MKILLRMVLEKGADNLIALYIILTILAILLILSLLPARCIFLINSDGSSIDIKYAFFKFHLYPSSKTGRGVVKDEEKKTASETKASEGKKNQFNILRNMLDDIIKYAKRIIKYIFHNAITIEKLNISAHIGTGDPADTGIICGGAYASVFGVLGFLSKHTKLKEHSVDISPDFDNTVISGGLYAILRTRIAHILILLTMVLKLIGKYKTISRRINK